MYIEGEEVFIEGVVSTEADAPEESYRQKKTIAFFVHCLGHSLSRTHARTQKCTHAHTWQIKDFRHSAAAFLDRCGTRARAKEQRAGNNAWASNNKKEEEILAFVVTWSWVDLYRSSLIADSE